LGFKITPSKGTTEGVTSITLSTLIPIKGIVLDVDGIQDVVWNNQYIDLMPGDDQVVEAKGLSGRDIKVNCLGDGSV